MVRGDSRLTMLSSGGEVLTDREARPRLLATERTESSKMTRNHSQLRLMKRVPGKASSLWDWCFLLHPSRTLKFDWVPELGRVSISPRGLP